MAAGFCLWHEQERDCAGPVEDRREFCGVARYALGPPASSRSASRRAGLFLFRPLDGTSTRRVLSRRAGTKVGRQDGAFYAILWSSVLAKNIPRQLISTNQSLQNTRFNVAAFVEWNRHCRSFPTDVRMFYHSVGALSTVFVEGEPRIMLV